MIRIELFIILLLVVVVAGSLSISSFESYGQNLNRDVIKFLPSTVISFGSSTVISFGSSTVVSFGSSTVVTSSSTSTVNCITVGCVGLYAVTGIIETVSDNDYHPQLKALSSSKIQHSSDIKTVFDSSESKHYFIQLFG